MERKRGRSKINPMILIHSNVSKLFKKQQFGQRVTLTKFSR